MIKTTWRRIDDNKKEYIPGRDSPENHYINDDVIALCVTALSSVTHRHEPRIEDMRTFFVYGLKSNIELPRTIDVAIFKCRGAVKRRYNKEWRREPYNEEFAAIFDAANKAR